MNEMERVQSKVRFLPGRPPFMLDRDLAKLYGTTVKRVNEAVKRNPERFPEEEGFIFQATKTEGQRLKLGIPSNTGKDGRGSNLKYLPKCFSRAGCNMLATVLNTPIAIERSIQITQTFTEMELGKGPTNHLQEEVLKRLSNMTESFNQRFHAIETLLQKTARIEDNTVPTITTDPNKPIQRRRHFKIEKDPDVYQLAVGMLESGKTHAEVAEAIIKMWPDSPEKWVTKSSIGRYWKAICCGQRKKRN